jgi:cytochrome bd-type quinol oxidase subunit 1
VAPVFYAFRVMVGLGMAMLGLTFWSAVGVEAQGGLARAVVGAARLAS